VSPAVQHYPRRIQRIRMAHERNVLVRVLARKAMDNTQHPVPHRLDGFVAREQPSLGLMDEPERPPQRDLPVRQALQVPAEFGFAKVGVGLEDRLTSHLRADDPRGLCSAREWAVHDAIDSSRTELVADRGRLRASQRAEAESVQMPVKDPARVLDVRVADEEEVAQLRYAPTEVRLVPEERPASSAW